MVMMMYTHIRLPVVDLMAGPDLSKVLEDAMADMEGRFIRTARIPRRDVSEGVLLPIMESPWPGFEPQDLYPVTATVKVSHDGRNLNLLYHVVEPELRRMCTCHNSEIWTDSCIEMFLSNPAVNEKEYVNFEFSASKYALVGRGSGRPGRILYDSEKIDSLPIEFRLLRNTATFEGMESGSEWTLSVSIPLAEFGLAVSGEDIGGLQLKGNFYKCGDGLTQPHYLMWNPIDTAKPEFHSPKYFGILDLEK